MAERLFPLRRLNTPRAGVDGLGQAMRAGDWARFNERLVEGMRMGWLVAQDLDMNPRSDSGRAAPAPGHLDPLYARAFELTGAGQPEAFWLMHTWEAALKTGLLERVIAEMPDSRDGRPHTGNSSDTLRGLFRGVRALLIDVDVGHPFRLLLEAPSLPAQADKDIVRLLYRLPGHPAWKGPFIEEERAIASPFSPFDDDENIDMLVRARPGRCVYTEGVARSSYDDGSCIAWSSGTAFFSSDSKALDVFVSKRAPLLEWESIASMLGAVHQEDGSGEKSKLARKLQAPEAADEAGEHRWARGRFLHRACELGDEQQIRFLIQAGAKPGRQPHEFFGPARDLVLSFNVEGSMAHLPTSLDLLIGAGLDVNETQKNGATLLMEAACLWHHSAEVMSVLIARGADPFIKDMNGKDIFDHARSPMALPGERECPPSARAFIESLRSKIAVDDLLSGMGRTAAPLQRP